MLSSSSFVYLVVVSFDSSPFKIRENSAVVCVCVCSVLRFHFIDRARARAHTHSHSSFEKSNVFCGFQDVLHVVCIL